MVPRSQTTQAKDDQRRRSRLVRRFQKGLREMTFASWILIILGTVTWSATMFKSGLVYDYGMGFWGPNGHDGIWHISIVKSLANGSWKVPIFAGETLKNYHIGFDLILAVLYKLTFIPITNLYFQIIPPVLALLIGVFVYRFVYTWKISRLAAFWATFFVYFGGSFGWIVTWFRNKEISGESLFWSQQSVSTLINPPFALSILFIFIALILLVKGLRYKNKKLLTISTFLFGLLIQVKVYAGLLVLGGLFVAGFWRLLKRKGALLIKVFAGALIISILIFSPLEGGAEKAIVFKPFWFLETMIGFQDRLNWPRLAEAMVNYRLGGMWIKGIMAHLAVFAVFLVGNLGLRIIGLSWLLKKLKNIRKVSSIDVFIVSVISGGIVLPMFFVQSGTAWNTIQFFYYSLVFSGIIAGISVASLFHWLQANTLAPGVGKAQLKIKTLKGKLPTTVMYIAAVTVLVGFSIFSVIATLRHYLPSRPPAMISKQELEALEFLSNQPDGVVLTMPFNKEKAKAAADNPPRPLYLYESTAYVSAFSGKPVYLEDEVNLEITGYDWRNRRKKVEDFFGKLDSRFLISNNIDYVYIIKDPRFFDKKINSTSLEKIFENVDVDVYKVRN